MEIKRVKIFQNTVSSQNVLREINKNNLTHGDCLNTLKESLKKTFKKKYCILTSNCFFSIFLSLKALGLNKKRVLIPEVSTCFSFVNAIKASGNIPVFCSVDNEFGNLNVSSIDEIYESKGFDAILSPNHMGMVLDTNLLVKYKVPIIEDCAQSFLTSSIKKSTSTVQVFSFYPTKVMNGIDGGAILTDDIELYIKANNLLGYDNQFIDDDIVRYNCKMLNVNAAYLLGNIDMLKPYKQKNLIHQKLYKKLESSKIFKINLNNNIFPYKILLHFIDVSNRDNFIKKFSNLGVSKEFTLLTKFNKNINKTSVDIVSLSCSLPIYYDLLESEINFIINQILQYENI